MIKVAFVFSFLLALVMLSTACADAIMWYDEKGLQYSENAEDMVFPLAKQYKLVQKTPSLDDILPYFSQGRTAQTVVEPEDHGLIRIRTAEMSYATPNTYNIAELDANPARASLPIQPVREFCGPLAG